MKDIYRCKLCGWMTESRKEIIMHLINKHDAGPDPIPYNPSRRYYE